MFVVGSIRTQDNTTEKLFKTKLSDYQNTIRLKTEEGGGTCEYHLSTLYQMVILLMEMQ